MSTASAKYILSIDLGTSGPKSGLVSTSGAIVDTEFEPVELILLPNGGAEQRPEEWWSAVCSTARKVVAKGLVPVEDIVAVCCNTQWSGTVPVAADGSHLGNAIIWMDTRGSRYIKQISDGLLKVSGYSVTKIRRWIQLTGGAPGQSGKDPLAHILYLKNEVPDVFERTHKFLEPKDFINFKFTGKMAASFDSIALHWITDNRNIDRVDYDERLLKVAGLERDKFPDLLQAVDILGPIGPAVADDLGLSRKVQVVMGTPDIPAAAIGSGAVDDFNGHLYIGTSSWLSCHVPFKKTDILHNIASLPSAIPGRYFVVNEQETAGACLSFLRDNVVYHKDELLSEADVTNVYQLFDQIADRVPAGSDKLIFTPWLYGERTPIEDHSVRSCLFNISLRTTREHIIRAVFEGVAFNARWLLDTVERFVKRPMDNLHMIGGGANSAVWCQIHADVLNRTVKQIKDPILANLRGAGFLAAVALGHLRFEDIPDLIEVAGIFEPNPDNRAIYDELYREYLNIYKKNKAIFARLNRQE